MSNAEKPARVLDPIERVSEVIFGLLMALTFTGSLSVATAGREDVRTMMIAALGCNLAWGLADAVMYLVRTVTERTRNRTLLAQLRAADAATGQRLVADALPPRLADAVGRRSARGAAPAPGRASARARAFPSRRARFQRGGRRFSARGGRDVPGRDPVLRVPARPRSLCACPTRCRSVDAVRGRLGARTVRRRQRVAGGLAMAVTGAALIGAIIALGG